MKYRTHEDGPETEIRIVPGAVLVSMHFDLPGCYTRLHSHAYGHWMHVDEGAIRLQLGQEESFRKKGERFFVPAHVQHGLWAAASNTRVTCSHEDESITADDAASVKDEGVRLEWLWRLTDKVEHAHS